MSFWNALDKVKDMKYLPHSSSFSGLLDWDRRSMSKRLGGLIGKKMKTLMAFLFFYTKLPTMKGRARKTDIFLVHAENPALPRLSEEL